MAGNGNILPNGNGNTNGNGKAGRLRKAALRWRTSHLVTGMIVGVWLAAMAVTGVLVNHQTDWSLDEVEVSNSYLPGHYTTEFTPDSNRLNVVLTDLHSGRFFGAAGKYISDAVGLLVLISIFSGFQAYRLRKKSAALCLEACDLACAELEREKPRDIAIADPQPSVMQPEQSGAIEAAIENKEPEGETASIS